MPQSVPNNTTWINYELPLAVTPLPIEQQLFRLTIVTLGFVSNAVLIGVISVSRQLRYPRHIYWIAVALVNEMYLIEVAIEMEAVVKHNFIACKFYVLNAGVSFSLQFLCISLAAIDRYLAIAKQEWYKQNVTNRAVIVILCSATIVTYVVITSPYWTGYRDINSCSLNMAHMFWVLTWSLLLGFCSLAIHVKIYITSRAVIRRFPQLFSEPLLSARFPGGRRTFPGLSVQETRLRFVTNPILETTTTLSRVTEEEESEQSDHQIGSRVINDVTTCNTLKTEGKVITIIEANKTNRLSWVDQRRPKINRLDIKTAHTMSKHFFPFWMFILPVISNSVALYWCIRMEADCTLILTFRPYTRDVVILFNGLYNPVMYMKSNSEFRRALAHLTRKLNIFS